MGSDATAPPPTGHPALDELILALHRGLAGRGELCVGSGSFDLGFVRGSIHTDLGPATQDKDINQDYALAWWPRQGGTAGRVRLALALADGVTSSFRAEWGAALACWKAVESLARDDGADEPAALARRVFAAAGQAIGGLGADLARDPGDSCPQGTFPSTWRYILRTGRLLETTLSLAWIEEDRLCLAMVGDGGAVCRRYENGQVAEDLLLAQCDLETNEVRALGPTSQTPREFDCWRELSLNGPLLAALFSDGIGRSLGDASLGILNDLEKLVGSGDQEGARRYIARTLADAPERFDDNVTLAVLRLVR